MTPHPLYSSLVFVAVLLVSPFESCQEKTVKPETYRLPRGPEEVVNAVEWAYDNRSLSTYRDLITADFTTSCGAGTRDDELRIFAALSDPYRDPPLRELTLDLGEPDITFTRPSHRLVEANFALRYAEGTDAEHQLTGAVRFFLVRGDSAELPDDLVEAKATPDARLWYIQGWESVSGDWCSTPGRN